MAGEYLFAKNKKDLLKNLRTKTPFGSKIYIDRSIAYEKRFKPINSKEKAYYVLIDVKNKDKKLLWHN